MAITDWPEAERPRERLLAQGPEALSDAELLAIFLRTGVKGVSAVELARDLIKHFGGLRALLRAPQHEFCAYHGLGSAKFAQLQAVLEMARRHMGEAFRNEAVFSSAALTRQYLIQNLRDLPREEFHVLLLNSQHFLIRDVCLFQGTINSAAVYPREVLRLCLTENAAAVILAHNHPSGIAEPSQADIDITGVLKEALGFIDVSVLDHQIVGGSAVVSLAERGCL